MTLLLDWSKLFFVLAGAVLSVPPAPSLPPTEDALYYIFQCMLTNSVRALFFLKKKNQWRPSCVFD